MDSPVDAFLKKSGVDSILEELRTHLPGGKPLVISDVTDGEGNQYVDLVQEGGGVWGIALVGFTYVLEEMGIRFFSLAGTSAGSINAMLIACLGKKQEKKSRAIVSELLALDFFRIVDGKKSNWRFTKLVKRLIQKFVLRKTFMGNLTNFFHWYLVLTGCLLITSFAAVFVIGGDARWLCLGAGILFLSLLLFGVWIYARFKNFCRHGYGLNEGNYFHHWIKKLVSGKEIHSLEDFSRHFNHVPPDLKVKEDKRRKDNGPLTTPMMAIITSDITSERKIQFPKMWDLYWKDMKDVHPGDFVRASMSIPAFFETYTVHRVDHKSTKEIWQQHLNWKGEKIPKKVQFVDGGVLSNFPINAFANPNNPVPRTPIIGIRLADSPGDQTIDCRTSLSGYMGSIIGTMRANFDEDFIGKNRSFELGIKPVYLKGHSWLNFFMDMDEKAQLFRIGAHSACNFLKNFDWEGYKEARYQDWLRQRQPDNNPNNFH